MSLTRKSTNWLKKPNNIPWMLLTSHALSDVVVTCWERWWAETVLLWHWARKACPDWRGCAYKALAGKLRWWMDLIKRKGCVEVVRLLPVFDAGICPCCNLSGGVALIVWFTTNGKNNTIIYVAWASNSKRDCDVVALPILTCERLNATTSVRKERLRAWSLLLLAATVGSFVRMLLGISDRNKMVLWQRCGGRAEFSLHTKNVWSVRFVVQRRGCCYNLSGGVALIVWFTTNGMCVKNNTTIYVARASNSKRDCDVVALPILTCERLNVTTSVWKERLRAWSLLLLAAMVGSFARMLLRISDRNTPNSSALHSEFMQKTNNALRRCKANKSMIIFGDFSAHVRMWWLMLGNGRAWLANMVMLM